MKKSSVQYTVDNDSLVFWAIVNNVRVELLRAKPSEASDLFRFHKIARENLNEIKLCLKMAA